MYLSSSHSFTVAPLWRVFGYHADAEDGEEQEPGQVGAAPVLQRSPFSLCPLKHTHTRAVSSAQSGPARSGSATGPRAANWITAAGSNPSAALSAPGDRLPFPRNRINTAEGHREWRKTEPGRAGPGLPQRYRSIPLQSGWTELHGASAQQQRGMQLDRRGRGGGRARSGERSRRSHRALRPAEQHATVCLLRLPYRAGINGRGFVRHTSWWAVRCSGHSYHCACAITVRAGVE